MNNNKKDSSGIEWNQLSNQLEFLSYDRERQTRLAVPSLTTPDVSGYVDSLRTFSHKFDCGSQFQPSYFSNIELVAGYISHNLYSNSKREWFCKAAIFALSIQPVYDIHVIGEYRVHLSRLESNGEIIDELDKAMISDSSSDDGFCIDYPYTLEDRSCSPNSDLDDSRHSPTIDLVTSDLSDSNHSSNTIISPKPTQVEAVMLQAIEFKNSSVCGVLGPITSNERKKHKRSKESLITKAEFAALQSVRPACEMLQNYSRVATTNDKLSVRCKAYECMLVILMCDAFPNLKPMWMQKMTTGKVDDGKNNFLDLTTGTWIVRRRQGSSLQGPLQLQVSMAIISTLNAFRALRNESPFVFTRTNNSPISDSRFSELVSTAFGGKISLRLVGRLHTWQRWSMKGFDLEGLESLVDQNSNKKKRKKITKDGSPSQSTSDEE